MVLPILGELIRQRFPTACRYLKNWRGARRCASLPEARAKSQAHAKERYASDPAFGQEEAGLAAREAKVAATGKKPGGKPPQPPTEGPRPSDQINLTDAVTHHACGQRRHQAVL